MSVLVSGRRSTLNPDAPLFIPAAFRQVEDFSPEWWQLVTTSPWFHDYWLSQHQDPDGFYDNGDNVADLLPETFDFDTDEDYSSLEAQFEEFIRSSESEEQQKAVLFTPNGVQKTGMEMDAGTGIRNLSLVNCLEERGKFSREPAKYTEKPSKCMSPKCSPRRIQQPR